jgi:hypothetical protein
MTALITTSQALAALPPEISFDPDLMPPEIWSAWQALPATIAFVEKSRAEDLAAINQELATLRDDLRIQKTEERMALGRKVALTAVASLRAAIEKSEMAADEALEPVMRGRDPFALRRVNLEEEFIHTDDRKQAVFMRDGERRMASVERLLVRRELFDELRAIAAQTHKVENSNGHASDEFSRFHRELDTSDDRRFVYELERPETLARLARELPAARLILLRESIQNARLARLSPDLRKLHAHREALSDLKTVAAAIEGEVRSQTYFTSDGLKLFKHLRGLYPKLWGAK